MIVLASISLLIYVVKNYGVSEDEIGWRWEDVMG